MPEEMQFLSSTVGAVVVIPMSILAFCFTVWWAFHREDTDRRAVFIASLCSAVLMTGITVIATMAGWWAGAWSGVPIITMVALNALAGMGGFALWLALYRALRRRTRRPLLAYAFVALLFVPIVLFADPIQIQRGWFEFGGAYTIWTDVVVGQVVMWMPVLLYETIRRNTRLASQGEG